MLQNSGGDSTALLGSLKNTSASNWQEVLQVCRLETERQLYGHASTSSASSLFPSTSSTPLAATTTAVSAIDNTSTSAKSGTPAAHPPQVHQAAARAESFLQASAVEAGHYVEVLQAHERHHLARLQQHQQEYGRFVATTQETLQQLMQQVRNQPACAPQGPPALV